MVNYVWQNGKHHSLAYLGCEVNNHFGKVSPSNFQGVKSKTTQSNPVFGSIRHFCIFLSSYGRLIVASFILRLMILEMITCIHTFKYSQSQPLILMG